MTTRTKTVWSGNAALRRRLKPIAALHPHPRNARRGDVQAIAASLERFGQQRAALCTPEGTIVAGNHTFRAATEVLGWTHFAADESDLQDSEIEAYLVADNRTSDLGTYDLPMLAALVEPFASNLTGLGFTADEYHDLITAAAGPTKTPDSENGTPPKPTSVKTLFLPFPEEDHEQVQRWLKMLGREWGTDPSATVFRLAYEAAKSL